MKYFLILWGTHDSILKPNKGTARKENYKKISHEHTYKNLQHNISKFNPTISPRGI